jgi:hypothetical protein
MRSPIFIALVLAATLGLTLIGKASAAPVNGMAAISHQVTNEVQDVRWVCGPYRCWWQPGPYWWGGPRWGWRHWGWHRWGWHRHWG